jgi:predicted nuclease with TOPRIM domain
MIAPIQTASAAPDFTSPYLPEIKSISWSGLNFNKGDGSIDGSGKTQFDVSARIHRNSLTYIEVYFANNVNYKPTALEADCQNYIGLSVGDWTKSLDARPLNLSSRVSDGDRYTERYIVEAATNGVVRPLCPGEYSLSSIKVYDAAGRDLQIRLGGWFNDNLLNQTADFWDKLGKTSSLLPCRVSGQGPRNLLLEFCNHTVSAKTIQFSVKASERKSLALPETVDYISKLAQSQNQIAVLTSDKASLQSQVTSLTSDKASLQSQVTSLTREKSTLQTQLTSLSADKAALTKAQSELNAANAALADSQKINREQAAKISSFEEQFKVLSESVATVQNQLSQLNSKLEAALAGQNAANAKLKKVCSAKPKPKSC